MRIKLYYTVCIKWKLLITALSCGPTYSTKQDCSNLWIKHTCAAIQIKGIDKLLFCLSTHLFDCNVHSTRPTCVLALLWDLQPGSSTWQAIQGISLQINIYYYHSGQQSLANFENTHSVLCWNNDCLCMTK